MASWCVVLEKPGQPNHKVVVDHLAPTVERVIDRLSIPFSYTGWRLLLIYDKGIFIETYEVYSLDPNNLFIAFARFKSMRRLHELTRNFDPKRLPV